MEGLFVGTWRERRARPRFQQDHRLSNGDQSVGTIQSMQRRTAWCLYELLPSASYVGRIRCSSFGENDAH